MKNNSSKIILIIIAILIIGGIFYFVNKPLEPEKITIAEFAEVFIYAPLYVADEKGFFQEEGLDVEIVPAGGLDKTWAAVVSGSAQFGVADPMITAISGEKGQPGVVVAGILNGLPFWGIAKDPNIPVITNPSQLQGYIVGTTPAPSTAYTMQTKLFQLGEVEPSIRELASGTCLPALEAGDVDICLELEPTVSTAVEKNGAHVVYALSDYYSEFALTGVLALPDYVENNKDTTQKVVNALQKGSLYIRENSDETVDILVKRFPNVERNIAEDAVARLIADDVFKDNVVVPKDGWNVAGEIRNSLGQLNELPKYEDYVLTEFAENALRNSG